MTIPKPIEGHPCPDVLGVLLETSIFRESCHFSTIGLHEENTIFKYIVSWVYYISGRSDGDIEPA